MSLLFRPTTELVAVAWARAALDGAGETFGVAATLPAATSWPAGAFLTLESIPMGTDVDVAENVNGYLQADAWAVNDATAGSTLKPSWAKAGQVVAALRAATGLGQAFGADLDLGPRFRTPRVQAAWIAVDEERITDDPSGYARFRVDLRLDWVTP